MACHYPAPSAVALLHSALDGMDFDDGMGKDAEVSEYGIPYKRVRAFDKVPEKLVETAQIVIRREFEAGAHRIIWRRKPVINGFEEKRDHAFVLVLEYHVLKGVADVADGVSNAETVPA